MQPVDWGEAFRIVVGGLVAVFFIMTLLATATHFMGKFFIAQDKRKKEAEKAAKAAAKAEAESKAKEEAK